MVTAFLQSLSLTSVIKVAEIWKFVNVWSQFLVHFLLSGENCCLLFKLHQKENKKKKKAQQ